MLPPRQLVDEPSKLQRTVLIRRSYCWKRNLCRQTSTPMRGRSRSYPFPTRQRSSNEGARPQPVGVRHRADGVQALRANHAVPTPVHSALSLIAALALPERNVSVIVTSERSIPNPIGMGTDGTEQHVCPYGDRKFLAY